MKNINKRLFASFIIGSLVLTPIFAGAHKGDDDDDSDSRKEDKIERRITKQTEKFEKKQQKLVEKLEKKQQKLEEKIEKKSSKLGGKCFTSWGHLIAFGWLKKNSSSEVELEDCNLPFGIWKKFGNFTNKDKATTTPDTTAPIISNINSYANHTSAIVAWETNENTTGKLYYSTTSPVSIATASVVDGKKGAAGKSHFATVAGLATGTTYYFLIEAKDKALNTTLSSQYSFITKGTTTLPVDTTAPLITATSTTVGTSTINVSWATNEAATSKVYYSTTTPINLSLSSFVQSGSFVTSHSLSLTELATGTLYYMLIESKDSATNTATSSEFATTTLSN